MKKSTKRLLLTLGLVALVVILTACGTSTVTKASTNPWDRYVIYNAAQFVLWLAKISGGNAGVGIILFTLIIRILIFPLSYLQIKSMAKQQAVAPEIKALQKQYSAKDRATQQKLRDETQRVYAEAGVNPVMGCLPIVVQMPFLIALYQAIWRTPALKVGDFLWVHLGSPDPYFIMPILAALFTLATSVVSTMAQPVRTSSNWIMAAVSPLMILFFAINLPSALAVYWVVTNAFSLGQTFFLQNPFKLRRERQEKAQAEKDHKKAVRKAYKRALRK
ncbi:YidC/Oxa1 family membrane protein insertase [Lacticaseibacillus salsurivasis]|uniref:YidC/Oxa1 family membrane protein insertase n=1 Tax=Lacticaseibacillus salsurivasis TaxID=3081441 RepID=UPI0030C769D3